MYIKRTKSLVGLGEDVVPVVVFGRQLPGHQSLKHGHVHAPLLQPLQQVAVGRDLLVHPLRLRPSSAHIHQGGDKLGDIGGPQPGLPLLLLLPYEIGHLDKVLVVLAHHVAEVRFSQQDVPQVEGVPLKQNLWRLPPVLRVGGVLT